MPETLNTDINIIGGLPDLRPLFRALGSSSLADTTSLERCLLDDNILNIKTNAARRRFLRAISNNILSFRNAEHASLVKAFLSSEGLEGLKTWLIFWQLILNNDLFRLITRDVFLKARSEGHAHLRRDQIDGYIRHLFEQSADPPSWSTETIINVGRKYLSYLSKTGLLEGSNPKSMKYDGPDGNTMIFLIYLMNAIEPGHMNILANPLMEFALVDRKELITWAKKPGHIDYFSYSYNGEELRLTPKLTPEVLAHELSQRT